MFDDKLSWVYATGTKGRRSGIDSGVNRGHCSDEDALSLKQEYVG